MSEISPSSLDARELLSRPIEQFHVKLYETWGDFRMLWGIVDIYLQRLDPVTRGTQTDIIPIDQHSPLYRETRQKLYLEITRMPGFDISRIQSINISPAGILTINYPDRSESINLINRWNAILLPLPDKSNILTSSEGALYNLDKDASIESLYDGSVLVSYIPGTVLTLAWAHALYDGGKKSIDTTKYIINKITIRDTNGKMRIIPLSGIYSWTKESIRGSTMKLLEKTGYMWDVVSKWWFSPIELSLNASKKEIQAKTYEEYKKSRATTQITEWEYNKLKSEVLGNLEKWSWMNWNERLTTISKSLSKNAGEIFFFPIFFRHFNTYQNSATLIAWIAEFSTFTLWAKYGAKYIRLPWIFRALSPLIAWWIATVGSHMWAEAMDISRKKWEYLSKDWFGSLYGKWKSTIWHFALGWGIQEWVDLINNTAQRIVYLTDIPSDDVDVGIPRIEIPLPWGRYLGTIPEVNMFQSTVSFGTAPWEWIRWAKWRSIDDWNKKVSLYQNVISRKIQELLWKYQTGSSMFASKDKINQAWSKEKLLEIHLRDIILGWGESDAFAWEWWSLIKELIKYISQDQKLVKQRTIDDIIKNRVSQMYVDDLFLEKRKSALKYTETIILPDLATQLSTQKDLFTYLASIPGRMIMGKTLSEWIIYQSLLENKNPITINFPNFSGQTTIGNAFTMYLEEALKFSRESEFLSEIQKWNKNWVQWTL